MLAEPPKQALEIGIGKKRLDSIHDDHGRTVARNVIEPSVGVQVGANHVMACALRKEGAPDVDDIGIVDINTEYGLAASMWSKDIEAAKNIQSEQDRL